MPAFFRKSFSRIGICRRHVLSTEKYVDLNFFLKSDKVFIEIFDCAIVEGGNAVTRGGRRRPARVSGHDRQ
jgi:hypothetical protein